MVVTRFGILKRKLKKENRENKKPLHERPHGLSLNTEDTEDLFFGDTPFALSAGDVE